MMLISVAKPVAKILAKAVWFIAKVDGEPLADMLVKAKLMMAKHLTDRLV